MIVRKCLIAAAAVLGLLNTGMEAEAALLSVDPAAMDGWQGAALFQASGSGRPLNVVVHYAVYAPGQYVGTDPSGGTDYLYAYQVFNDVAAGSTAVSSLTVGLTDGCGARWIGWDASAPPPGADGGIAPTFSSLSWESSSARWYFISDPVEYGERSALLLFTSPLAPRWMDGSIQDSGLSDTQPLPSPVPEPATLAMLGLGGLAAMRLGRRSSSANAGRR